MENLERSGNKPHKEKLYKPIPSKERTAPNEDREINPSKLDREENDFEPSVKDDSKGHQPYEFKSDPLSEGSNNLGVSGGAGGAQFGAGANTPGREGSNINNQAQRNGVGGGNDSRIRQEGQGSKHMGKGQRPTNTTKGTLDNSLRGSNGGVDGQRSGKGSSS